MEENKISTPCEALVIGGSAGSLEALLKILPNLKTTLAFPVVIVLHRKNTADSTLADLLSSKTNLLVKETEDKEPLIAGQIFVAPADYHLLFENRTLLALDDSEKVNYSRPSIDVTFESAADVFGPALTCLLLSGANADGSAGLIAVKERGGRVLIQDPGSADSPFMPLQAIAAVRPDAILKTQAVADYINTIS